MKSISWAKRNPEKRAIHTQRYRSAHKDQISKSSKRYYKCNKVRINKRTAEYRRSVLALNPKKVREYNLRHIYNISLQEFERLARGQNYKCAICSAIPQLLHVDHCHKKGTIRGLLCQKCNTGLGFFLDSTKLLKKATIYLSSNQTNNT